MKEERKGFRRLEGLRREEASKVTRAEALRVFDDLTRLGPGNEGLVPSLDAGKGPA